MKPFPNVMANIPINVATAANLRAFRRLSELDTEDSL